MVIKKFSEPSEEIIKEIRKVELICKEHDKLNGSIFLDTSINFNSEIKSLFLLYDSNILVSLVSMFIPTRDEAEISAYTLPKYRRKGYFKKLLHEAIKEITKYNILDLVFVCEPQSNDGNEVIEKLKAEFDFTEYFLRYNDSVDDMEVRPTPEIKLKEAEKEDLESLINLSQEIFNDNYEDAKSMIIKSFESENRIQYIGMIDKKHIGMGSASLGNDEASIFGFGVSPQYQGKGFGRAMLKRILTDLKNRGRENITIEVDSTNKNAFNLYKKCGFKVETSFDYYRKRPDFLFQS
ncbi:ribosomal protein S18 acetylase RimI-like enzyme [Alkalibaculum bacchi]|uniref:Ribosomal protein S18 acetylase RimI-like enzyme n=1 Tax=Alkalibaculum bacchi TaxID=645887 RepID=A0A366IA51_9FIRM|nr:ribosomal protein S18 acetylase RimI-like enzyme [Alkalibaculum bacchi]